MRPTKKIYYVKILKVHSFNDDMHIFLSEKEQKKFISDKCKNKSFESGCMMFQKPYYFEEYKLKTPLKKTK